jgi:hypothetical protein
MMRYRIPSGLLAQTFAHFRECGAGRRECQVVWTSPWVDPETIRAVVHPRHLAHGGGFELDSAWLTAFWLELARTGCGIRIQAHTHPFEAFHSAIDDEYPIIHTVGFLSLVLPNFAMGPVGFDGAYLAEIQSDGTWREVSIGSRLEVIS